MNNAEELGEGNGGANEIGQMKNRPRARAQPSCRPRLYGYQRRKWWQRWRRRRCD